MNELNQGAAPDLLRLAPFGCGNPPPLLLVAGAEVAGPPAIFKQRHLRVCLRQGWLTLMVKAWDFAERVPEPAAGARVGAAIALEPDSFAARRGQPGRCATLQDVRPSQLIV